MATVATNGDRDGMGTSSSRTDVLPLSELAALGGDVLRAEAATVRADLRRRRWHGVLVLIVGTIAVVGVQSALPPTGRYVGWIVLYAVAHLTSPTWGMRRRARFLEQTADRWDVDAGSAAPTGAGTTPPPEVVRRAR